MYVPNFLILSNIRNRFAIHFNLKNEIMDQNREAVTAFYEKALTVNTETNPEEILSSILASDFKSIGSLSIETKEQLVGRFIFFWQLVPNLKCEIQELLNDGDRYIVRSKATGSPNGDFMGIPTNGSKSFDIMTIDVYKVIDGQIQEVYHLEDWGTAIQQLS